MNLTSPAFERNGQIPIAYTCEGVGISPPLHWARIPPGAKSLLLYMIDDSAPYTKPNAGVQWMVANINPEVEGVAAGQVPEGAVVGEENAGKTGYGAVCPESGKTDDISFVMYAFKEKFNLNPGFSKQEALEQYSGSRHDLMLGEWASTFAEYTRP